ncbi:hypothetical protein [Brevibacillus sp. SYSU BS000544]|uniref:hypothetical protein n=1 Tax=Brevibacillus sp. SYSU BS000544 TaxID=3416443 RepID=UPI003CE50171
MATLILWLMLILSWLSLLFINKHSLKRFMPVAIFSTLLVTVIFEMGYAFNWWTLLVKFTPWQHFISTPLVFGGFLAGTIWIFHFTYDKSFWMYLLTNVVVDAFYAFGILNLYIYFGLYRLDRMGNWGIFMLMLFLTFVIYAYQKWQDGALRKRAAKRWQLEIDIKKLLLRKEKAR